MMDLEALETKKKLIQRGIELYRRAFSTWKTENPDEYAAIYFEKSFIKVLEPQLAYTSVHGCNDCIELTFRFNSPSKEIAGQYRAVFGTDGECLDDFLTIYD